MFYMGNLFVLKEPHPRRNVLAAKIHASGRNDTFGDSIERFRDIADRLLARGAVAPG